MPGIVAGMLILGAAVVCAQTEDSAEEIPAEPPPFFAAAEVAPDYQNFTVGERLGTYLLNCLVPGLGSYAVMNDVVGGTFQVGMIGADVFCMVAGTVFFAGKNNQWELGLIIAGGALAVTNVIFNVIRSITYAKPHPNAWSVAVLPGENGVEQVHLAYTLRF